MIWVSYDDYEMGSMSAFWTGDLDSGTDGFVWTGLAGWTRCVWFSGGEDIRVLPASRQVEHLIAMSL